MSIYTGKTANWRDVAGKDGPVTVVNKAEGRSTLELFLHHFHLKNADIQAHVVIGDNEQGIRTVAGNPNAIGYVSIGAAEYDATHGVPIKLLPVEGAEPSIQNVQNGSFPLARPLNLVTHGPRATSKPLIQTTDLSVHYGAKTVLANVSLDVPAGEITALVGPSGSGKTSFLTCLTDLIPGCKTTGSVHLDGMNIRAPKMDVIALRRRVGMIFQKPNPFPLSIRKTSPFPSENTAFATALRSTTPSSRRSPKWACGTR